jgi:hypothetical protein
MILPLTKSEGDQNPADGAFAIGGFGIFGGFATIAAKGYLRPIALFTTCQSISRPVSCLISAWIVVVGISSGATPSGGYFFSAHSRAIVALRPCPRRRLNRPGVFVLMRRRPAGGDIVVSSFGAVVLKVRRPAGGTIILSSSAMMRHHRVEVEARRGATNTASGLDDQRRNSITAADGFSVISDSRWLAQRSKAMRISP